MNDVGRLVVGLVLGAGVVITVCGLRGVRLPEHRRPLSPRRSTSDETELVEALAVWTEQLRDTMAGARGLEQALAATAATVPEVLRPAVGRLSARLGVMPLPRALRGLATDLNHPLADFVTAALIVAAENHVRDLVSLLTHLAECCRDDVRMRSRVWVARARLRSAVRIITVVIVAFVAGLMMLQHEYLRAYASGAGVLVLVIVAMMFGSSLLLLSRLGRFETTSRFVARETAVTP
jgi:Flp pilus assembly protein TadB